MADKSKHFSESGEVTSARAEDRYPDLVNVTVAYGKRKPIEKATKNRPYPSNYDDRRTSTFCVPKSMAGQYTVGKRVTIHIVAEGEAKAGGKTKRGPSAIVAAMTRT